TATNTLPLIRSGAAAEHAFLHRYRRAAVLATIAIVLGLAALLLDWGMIAVVLCGLAALVGLVMANGARSVLRRLSWLDVLVSIGGLRQPPEAVISSAAASSTRPATCPDPSSVPPWPGKCRRA